MTAPDLLPEHKPLRDNIRRCVNESGLTQVSIAAHLGISEKHLSHMLLGKASMTLEWAARIADVCGYELIITITPKDDQ